MMGPFWAMPTALLSGTTAAAGIAFIDSVGNLGGFFGPHIIGLVRTSTGHFAGGLLVVVGALAVSGGLVLIVGIDPRPCPLVNVRASWMYYPNLVAGFIRN
jgi:MFS transporter, ACS family, tartrate transporter